MTSPIHYLRKEEFKHQMRSLATHRNILQESYYVIKPIVCSATIQLKRSKVFDMNIPSSIVTTLIDKIQVHLSELQLKQIGQLKERIELFRTRKKYRMYRPLRHTPSTDPLRFWKFLYQAHLDPIRKKIRARSGVWLLERRKYRLEYMKLWKEKLLSPKKKEVMFKNHQRVF